jgi:PAS domain S-box-containing protein
MEREDGLWLQIDEQKTPDGGIIGMASDITSVKLAEKALRASETRFRQHASATSDWLWEIDAERRYTFISDVMEDQVGRSPSQYLGTTVDQTIDKLYNRAEWQPFLDAFEARRPFRDLTVRRRDPDGTEQWIRTSGVPFYDDDNGEFLGYRGSASDVTDHVAARKQLAHLTTAINQKNEIVVIYDPDDRLVFFNDAFRDFNKIVADLIRPGITFEALTRASLDRGLFPEAMGREENWLAEQLERHRNPTGPIEQRRQDGVWQLILEQRLEDGGTVSIISDITDRKNSEDALAASEERFRSVFNHAPTAIALKDTDGRHTLVNATYEAFFNLPAEKILGRTLAELYSPEVAARHEANDRKVLETKNITTEDIEISHRNLPVKHLRITKFPVFDQHGEVSGVGTFATDISAQKAAEERLVQSQKMEAIGQLTGGIAHEFNNLLQVVAGNVELLADGIPPRPEHDKSIQAILRNVKRGADLTGRLLSFARRQPLAPKALIIRNVLTEMQNLLSRTLGERIEVRTEFTEDIWLAEADPNQLENALLNLALNARDAMPDGGIITIAAANISLDDAMTASHEEASVGDYVLLSVTDNGSGMTDREVDRAFEPFFTTKDVGKGTGLGLSMVYGFARQSGGFAEIDSALERGTTISLYIPRLRVAVNEEAAVRDTSPVPSADPVGAAILLVEDDVDVRESLAAQLIGMGYEVTEAENGDKALLVTTEGRRFDLLFTDVVMPGSMSGLGLARHMLRLQPDLKVLFTTGYSEDVVAEAEHIADGVSLLRKPFNRDKLAATIARILD